MGARGRGDLKLKKGKLSRTTYSRMVVNFLPNPLRVRIRFAFMQRGAYGTVEMKFTLENIARVFDPLYYGDVMGNSEDSCYYYSNMFINWLSIAYTITIVDRKYRSILLLLATIPFWINFSCSFIRMDCYFTLAKGLVNTFHCY